MIDALFADPLLNIPDQTEEIDRLKRWIKEEIQQNPLIFYCYDLGKPQLIAAQVNEINQESQTEEIGTGSPRRCQAIDRSRYSKWIAYFYNFNPARDWKGEISTRKELMALIASPNERDPLRN